MAQLFQMRVRMKNLMGVMEGGSIPALNNLEEALKAEQKVPRLFSFPLYLIYILQFYLGKLNFSLDRLFNFCFEYDVPIQCE